MKHTRLIHCDSPMTITTRMLRLWSNSGRWSLIGQQWGQPLLVLLAHLTIWTIWSFRLRLHHSILRYFDQDNECFMLLRLQFVPSSQSLTFDFQRSLPFHLWLANVFVTWKCAFLRRRCTKIKLLSLRLPFPHPQIANLTTQVGVISMSRVGVWIVSNHHTFPSSLLERRLR